MGKMQVEARETARVEGPQGEATALFSTREAANHLGVKPSTLEQWRWNGRGPRFVKVGRLARYRLGDLERFISARSFSNTAESGAARGGV